MDDLWGPSHYTQDAIEEDALHEKSCVQVLRILITKADTEIDELENDLVSLQSEVAWAEYEDWSEVCCNALREKIDYLDISIKTLRNEKDTQIYLLMHREPAERLHEIVKALLKNYGREKDEQTRNVTPQSAAELLDENTKSSNFDDAEIIIKEEIVESSNNPEDNCRALNPSLKFQVKITNELGIVKLANVVCPIEEQLANVICPIEEQLANVNVKNPVQHSLKSAAGHSNKKKISNSLDIKSTGKGEAKELGFTASDKEVLGSSSPKSAEKRRHDLEIVKIEPAGAVKVSTIDALKCSILRNNKISTYESKIKREEVEDSSSLSAVDVPILNFARRAYVGENLKPKNTLVKDSAPITHMCATGYVNEIKKLCKSDLRPNGYDKVREYQTTATDKSKTLAAFRHGKSVNSDIEQKLCDFALKAACKQRLKESKVASTENMLVSKSFLKAEGKKKNLPQILEIGEAGLAATEHSALTSLLDLQGERDKDTAMLQTKENGKPEREEVQMAKLAANDDELILNLTQKPPRQKAKRDVESNQASFQRTSFLAMENVSNSSSSSKGKKQSKSRKNASLNESLNRKITKKIVKHGPCETEEPSAGLVDSRNSAKKRKRSPNLEIVMDKDSIAEMEFSEVHGESINSESKNDLPIKDDSGTEAVASSSFATSNLKDLKMGDLRAIAKEQKLTQYYKLKKNDLVEQLTSRLGCC